MNDSIYIEHNKVGDISVVFIVSDHWQCKIEKVGNLACTKFNGKAPSRRCLSEIMKKITRISENA